MRSGEGLCGVAGEVITQQNQEGTGEEPGPLGDPFGDPRVITGLITGRVLGRCTGRTKEEQGKDQVLRVVPAGLCGGLSRGGIGEGPGAPGGPFELFARSCAAGERRGTGEGPGPPGGPSGDPRVITGLILGLITGRVLGLITERERGGTGEGPRAPGGPSGCAAELSRGGTGEGPGAGVVLRVVHRGCAARLSEEEQGKDLVLRVGPMKNTTQVSHIEVNPNEAEFLM
ncbi:hypothetical protein Dimus_004308 [Dionaea muscipula]